MMADRCSPSPPSTLSSPPPNELIIEGESYQRRQKRSIDHASGEFVDDENEDQHDHS